MIHKSSKRQGISCALATETVATARLTYAIGRLEQYALLLME